MRKIDRAAAASSEYTVTINGRPYAVKLDGERAEVNGVSYSLSVKNGISEEAARASAAPQPAAPRLSHLQQHLPFFRH